MKHYVVAALVLAGLAAPASSQTLIDRLIAKVGKPKDQLAASGQNGTAGSNQFLAPITPTQQATIDRLMAVPLQDPRLAADRIAAAPLIRTLLVTAGCARNDAAWNAVNRFHLTPTTWNPEIQLDVPMGFLNYHDKSTCMDVSRLTGWQKPANNALTFTAYYIAADSGEASHQTYQLQRASDGNWMIRDIGHRFQ